MLPEFFKEKYFGICQEYYNSLKAECDKCNKEGHILVDENTYRDCECTKTFLKNKEYIKAGVSVFNFAKGSIKFSELFTEDCQERFKQLIKFVRQLKESTNIFIHSKERKDHSTAVLAGLLAVNLIDVGTDTAVVLSSELIDTFFNFDRDERGWDNLCEIKVLIINGFGRENNKQLADEESFVTTRFMNFLNLRESMNNTTIIVGDLILDDLKGKYCDTITKHLVVDCLKFESSVVKKKESAIERLNKTNPEVSKIFSTNKVNPHEGEAVKQKAKTNRGRTL